MNGHYTWRRFKLTEESKERYITIKEMFEEVLDNQEIQIFRFAYNGSLWAGTDKKPSRVTINIPGTIVDKNLKTLDDFIIFGVAIPREIIHNLPDKKEDQDGSSG